MSVLNISVVFPKKVFVLKDKDVYLKKRHIRENLCGCFLYRLRIFQAALM